MQCIDLLERFGNTYRIEDEAGGIVRRRRRQYEPWGLVLPCSLGHIYPIGGDHLGASTNRRGPVANRIASIPGVVVVQDGSDGVNLRFHINEFDEVAKIMKPRRRRRLSDEEKADRAERLRRHRFSPASHDAENDRRRDGAERGESEDHHSAA